MNVYLTQVTILRTDRDEEVAVSITDDVGATRMARIDENSALFDRLVDGIDAVWDVGRGPLSTRSDGMPAIWMSPPRGG